MAQLIAAADNAGTSILDTISRAAGSVDKTIHAVDDALDVLLCTTSEWKEKALQEAQLNRLDRIERHVNLKALEIAKDQRRMKSELDSDPELRALFDAIKGRHKAALTSE